MYELSPLDGRYAKKVDSLRPYFSEEALMLARVKVEIAYFIALSDEPGIRDIKLNQSQKKALMLISEKFSEKDAKRIRQIESKTNHDVKAVEYFLREKISKKSGPKIPLEFIHFALTSEDVNNLAYGILIHDALKNVIKPQLNQVMSALKGLSNRTKKYRMLSLTHGQPATPTTLGKEIAVFVDRLDRQREQLSKFKMQGKFGGAVANYSAHRSAYPDIKWETFGARFVRSLGLSPLSNSTQINPHDDTAELSHIMIRMNTILLDLSCDVWMYISRGIFGQKIIKGEVGSSTMPHKVNPIDFENAEGNLGLSSALFDHFALKLPVSRLQRDLSDSTVQRNIGVAFGYHLLSTQSLQKGLAKLTVNIRKLTEELELHPEVHGEAIQTVMRRYGYADAYERMKKLTRGERITFEQLFSFIDTLNIPLREKDRLKKGLRK